MKKSWIAEQGSILCESTANKYGYLTTEKTYRHFDLRLKFKDEASGNSGVFFHSKITGIDPQHGPTSKACKSKLIQALANTPVAFMKAAGGAGSSSLIAKVSWR